MALTPSNMLPLGTVAPDFNLLDTVTDKNIGLKDIEPSKGTVIMFICNHCPYVIHIQDEIASMAKEYSKKGISFVAISSNDVENYPADSPEKMKERAKELDFNFPYLYDETQEVAKAYMAACTPDFYVFDENLKCVYRGRMDEATPGNGKPVNGQDLRTAMDAVINGTSISEEQFPSMGCNIKWK
ncbi:MAG: thioredoxin family protein [bacterium]|nr:thioredoxin family protein [bacterium]